MIVSLKEINIRNTENNGIFFMQREIMDRTQVQILYIWIKFRLKLYFGINV